jgi:hypothetical protein
VTARNPGLCRRVARAVQPLRLEMPDRAVIAALVESAASFEALPAWLQQLITRGESAV